ncbi:MAG: glycosyltransferase family 4 protein [Bacteroides sp.]|nr:glycosyltransferase family 4 protein [Bacteroides sp.]
MAKKKILFLVNKDNVIYNFRRELAFELINQGYEVYISCPYGKKIDFMTEKGCKFIDLKIDRRGTSIINDLKLIGEYYRLIKSLKPDVVLTYTSKCSIYGGMVCKWLKVPYIVNNAGLIETSHYSSFVGVMLNLLYKLGFKGASCMMYQNSRERDFIQSLIGETYHRDIPGSGVNLNEFKFSEYPANDNLIRFNYVARIVDFKGINELLACAERITTKYQNTEFVLYGDYDDESYREKVEALEARGIVKYGGIQLDMKPCIAVAHCVIHPSYYEGITNVILEHGAMGRPAIASDIPGCKEPIDNGKSGYTFELKNVDDLVAKVEKFILLSHEEKAAMGKAAREKIEREYDRNIVTNIYIEEINKILNKSN